MKAEELVTRQFKLAEVAWKQERADLQAEIIGLKEKLVGKALGTAKVAPAAEKEKPRVLEGGLKKPPKEAAPKKGAKK